jgi:chromosome partitioning protein
MPTIVFATPKGGSGKSTSAVLLATELVASGATVTIIDADPNRPVARWGQLPGCPASLIVLSDVSERTIVRTIEALIGFRGGEASIGKRGREALVREQKRA